jgi:hypothetical protein
MRTSTVLVWGGVGLIGYLIYRSLKSTVQTAAGNIASTTAGNSAIPPGLQAQIDAGQYDASALRASATSG